MIHCDQPRSLNLGARRRRRLETVPEDIMDEVLAASPRFSCSQRRTHQGKACKGKHVMFVRALISPSAG